MADYIFKGYDNFVLQEQIKSILNTKVDLSRFFTADYQLAENPGMVKKIHKYTGSGTVDDLARGEGNTHFVDAEYSEVEYRVARTQGQAKWYDDDQMTDPTLIDAKIQYLSEGMVNNWNAKAIAEFDKTTNDAICTDFGLNNWADAINKFTSVHESEEGLYALCNIDLVPTLRKALGDYLKYTEGYIKTGAIGTILGVPVYFSKAVPKDIIFLATRDAVTAFIKKDVNVEQDRDIDKKENFVVASRYAVIALTDETKCIKMGKAQATALTGVADVSDETISGAAPTGAVVYAYDEDGVELGHATASSNAYSISSDDFAANDKIKLVSVLEGYLPSRKEITAQA